MSDDAMFHEAIDAITQGKRARARDLITRLLKTNQANPLYWLWMSSVVDSPTERIYCLETVLRLEPDNLAARRGLVLLGVRAPDESVVPVPPIRRKWAAALGEETEIPRKGLARVIHNPVLRTASYFGITILVVGLIWMGIFAMQNANQGKEVVVLYQLTVTAKPSLTPTQTPTPQPTQTPVVRSPTPTFVGATPLWMLLEATYTPAPPYINTPHAVIEAYRSGMRSYQKGNYKEMLAYMKQAAVAEPEAPDILYYLGEAYRYNDNLKQALEAYNQAIKIAPTFAPAYLGRAITLLAEDPDNSVGEDLDKAIEYDPNMTSAYLARISYRISQGEYEAALEDLVQVEELAPDSPLLYLYRAQAAMAMDEVEAALENAQLAHDMDLTLLPAYLTLGQAHIANNQPKEAIPFLRTYLLYEEEDALSWLWLGKAYLDQGDDLDESLRAFDQSLELDSELVDGYYYRGLAYLALEEGQDAINEFARALRFTPRSFAVNLGLGQALLLSERPNDAYAQLRATENMAGEDEQYAAVYYWRAQALEALGNPKAAILDWEALLELPEEALPVGWAETAQEHLLVLRPPTLTPTPVTPTATATSTRKPPTATPTRIPATATPRSTITATPTPDY